MNPLDIVTLLGVMVVLVLIQAPVLLASMYGLHRFMEPTEYGDFNFDALTQEGLQRFLLNFILPLIGASTVVLSLLGVLMAVLTPRAHVTIGVILVGLQFGIFYAGLAFWLHLDTKKSAMLAGANAFIYIFLYAFILTWAIR